MASAEQGWELLDLRWIEDETGRLAHILEGEWKLVEAIGSEEYGQGVKEAGDIPVTNATWHQEGRIYHKKSLERCCLSLSLSNNFD
jgi:hypothetical protein